MLECNGEMHGDGIMVDPTLLGTAATVHIMTPSGAVR